MKIIKKFSVILSVLSVAVGCLAANVSAYDDYFYEDVSYYDYDSPEPFAGFGLDSEGNISHNCNYMNIWHKTVVDKSFTIGSRRELRIESLGKTPEAINDGRLLITGGAEVELAGKMFIERGGVLEIEDGTLTLRGGYLTNCGKIIIGKNGRLNIERGILMSQAAGEIENNGILSCMNTRKDLNAAFKKIAKTDEHFNLSDYWLFIRSYETYADVWLNYCIGDIKTDYSYKFRTDVNYDKITIKRKPYDMKKVYSASAEKKLLDRIEDFEDSVDYVRNIKIGFYRDYGYEYSYKTDKLFFESIWFEFEYDEFGGMFYDGTYYKDL